MALGQTAGCPRVNRAKKFMCSPRNTGNINFSLWLTGGLSQGCPDFQKVYVFKVYVPFSCPKKGGFVKGRFWRMYPRSSFWYRGTSACTLVPVSGTGEHPNVARSGFLVPGNIRQDHPFGNYPFTNSGSQFDPRPHRLR